MKTSNQIRHIYLIGGGVELMHEGMVVCHKFLVAIITKVDVPSSVYDFQRIPNM